MILVCSSSPPPALDSSHDYYNHLNPPRQRRAKDIAVDEMTKDAKKRGAYAVIGIDIDYESINVDDKGSMLMVAASGTAVVVR